MAKSKAKHSNSSPKSPSVNPLSDSLIDIDNETNPGDRDASASASGQSSDQLSPCIFHLYFGICGNADCKSSHSIKAIASRPSSRPTSPLSDDIPRTPRDNKFSRSHNVQICKYFSKGGCKFGNRCRDSHERPKTDAKSKSDGPWRIVGTSNGTGAFRPERSKGATKGTSTDSSATSPEQEVEIVADESSARADEISADAVEANDDRMTGSPIPEHSPIPVGRSFPPLNSPPGLTVPNESGEYDFLNGEHPTTRDAVSIWPSSFGVPDSGTNELDTSERGATGAYVDGELGEDNENDDDDKWGWNEAPQKKQGSSKAREQDPWNLEGIREEEVEIEVEALEYASNRDNETEGEHGRHGHESFWNQPPGEDQIQDEIKDSGDAWIENADDEEGENADDGVRRDQGPIIGHSERELGQETEGEIYGEQWSLPEPEHGSNTNPLGVKGHHQTPDPSLAPSIHTRSSIRSTPSIPPSTKARSFTQSARLSMNDPSTPSTTAPVPSDDPRQTSMMWLHWCRFADPSIDPSIAFCKAFAQNKCSNAVSDACKFRHCLTLQEYTLLFKDTQPIQFSLPKHLIRNDSPPHATLITSPSFVLHWSHFADPMCDPDVAFCKSYSEHTCQLDIACKFRHCLTLEEYTLLFKDPQPNLITTGSTPRTQSTNSRQGPATNRNYCMYFKKGTCKNGSNCPFYHDTSSTCPNIQSRNYCSEPDCQFCLAAPIPHQPSSGPGKKVCQFWPKGTCRNGEKCPYAHDGESGIVGPVHEEKDEAWENTAGSHQPDAWGANTGDTQGWVNWDDGNEADKGEQNNEDTTGEAGEDNTGPHDHPQSIGWGDQPIGNEGWGDHPVDTDGWGQTNDNWGRGDWGAQNSYGKRGSTSSINKSKNKTSYNDQRNSSNDYRSTRRNQPCRDNQKGRCKWGSGCRFSHDLQPGGSSGHDSRDASQLRQLNTNQTPPSPPAEQAEEDVNPPAPARRSTSTYGGRGIYEGRGYIQGWSRNVAESSAGSEAGDSRASGRPRDSSASSRRGGRGRGQGTNGTNRSVERPPTGNGSCQFYLVGQCSIGDTCPSSHDPVATEIGIESVANIRNFVEDEDDEFVAQEVIISKARLSGREGQGQEEDRCTADIEIEDVAPNDDTNRVVNSEWGHDAHWDDEPVVFDEQVRVNKPCLFYGQGFCKAGDYCRFLHIDPELSSPERSSNEGAQPVIQEVEDDQHLSEPSTRVQELDIDPQHQAEVQDYGHPLVERSILGCAVIFGRNCLPEKVTTGTDSHILLLEGPPDITETRVHDVVNKYGPIKDIIITHEGIHANEGDEGFDQAETTPIKSLIRVEFKEMKDAAVAAKDLDAALGDAIPIVPAPSRSTWARFKWPQPARAAWVFYSTITKAKSMAERLNGTVFQDRKVSASFIRPDKRQKDLFAVKLEKLQPGVTREDLTDIVQDCKLITISELTYTDKPRDFLQGLMGLKELFDVPEDPTKVNVQAFARFDSEEAVSSALQMHRVRHDFLGKQELSVEKVWFAHYTLPTAVFKLVSTEVAAIQVQSEGRIQIDSSDLGDHHAIFLYGSDDEASAFTKANLLLQAICRGTTVMTVDRRPEWDGYFYSSSSTKAIENLNSKNQFFIFLNASTRQIRVFGSGADRDKGVSLVQRLLQKVRDSCQEYTLHRNVLQQLVNGGLSEIQGEVGVSKLSLDVRRSVLVVRGGDAALLQKIRHLLEYSPDSESPGKSTWSGQRCSICQSQLGDGDSRPIVKLFCGHVYCATCLQHALNSAIHDHSAPVRCIGNGQAADDKEADACDQPIVYTTVRDLLPLLAEPDYLKAAFISFLHSNLDEYFFCPSLRCDAVYRYGEPREVTRCPMCRAWICLFCGSLTHDGLDCQEANETRKVIST